MPNGYSDQAAPAPLCGVTPNLDSSPLPPPNTQQTGLSRRKPRKTSHFGRFEVLGRHPTTALQTNPHEPDAPTRLRIVLGVVGSAPNAFCRRKSARAKHFRRLMADCWVLGVAELLHLHSGPFPVTIGEAGG
jgi:hypothetical protein